MENIRIRKAAEKDINVMSEIFKKTFTSLFEAQKLSQSTIQEIYSLNDPEHMLKRIKENHFFIAQESKSKKVVGIIGLRKDKGSESFNRISTFLVLPEHQGKGIGKYLYKKILALIKKFGIKKIVVNSSQFAEPFYKHLGFKKVRIVSKKYSNGDVYKNVWMEKRIEL